MAKPLAVLSAVRGSAGVPVRRWPGGGGCFRRRPGFGPVLAVVVVGLVLGGCGSGGSGGAVPESCVVPDGVVDAKYCVDAARSVAAPVTGGGVAGGGVGCVHGGRAGLCRVVALRDVVAELPDGGEVVRAERGDVGGWIQTGRNLAHEGGAWVGDAARVFGDAAVSGDALVSGNAAVFDDAAVSGDAVVDGNAAVFGDAEVYGTAEVGGEAQVFDSARIYGRAQVGGQAMVFDSSHSQHWNGEDADGDPVYRSVFKQHDPARVLWTNSPVFIPFENSSGNTIDVEWISSFGRVVERVGELSVTLVPASRDEWDDDISAAPYRPTAVFGDAVVYGRARVWGGSYVGGGAEVHQDGRVSGQTNLGGGDVCGDLWVHSAQNLGGPGGCAGSGGFSWVWVWVFAGLLLLVVAGWRIRRSGRSGLGFG